MDCDSAGSSVHGILQARILECVAVSFSILPSSEHTHYPLSPVSFHEMCRKGKDENTRALVLKELLRNHM